MTVNFAGTVCLVVYEHPVKAAVCCLRVGINFSDGHFVAIQPRRQLFCTTAAGKHTD